MARFLGCNFFLCLAFAGLTLVLVGVDATAQTTAPTVLAVKSALEDALSSFNTSISTADSEVRSTGDLNSLGVGVDAPTSLTEDVQNVLSDLNSGLGGRLDSALDKLSTRQLQLVQDAQPLTKQLRAAAVAAPNRTDSALEIQSVESELAIRRMGKEVRRTIYEADITAYNASYSLPCRDQIPRTFYVTPNQIWVGAGDDVVKVHGNFLDLGTVARAEVDSVPAHIVYR
jgi:hypothetical protein